MGTEWMGRYRELVGALVRHSNVCNKSDSKNIRLTDDIVISQLEWQVFEYIIEHRSDDDHMLLVYKRLAIPQSTFSKTVSKLCQYKLIAKYKSVDNKKNVLLKPTAFGEAVYANTANSTVANVFNDFFSALEDVDDKTLKIVADAINVLNDTIAKPDKKDLL